MLPRRRMQLEILGTAAKRSTGFVLPLPASVGDACDEAASLLEEMIAKEFVVERPVLPHEAFWLDPNVECVTVLVITGLGLRALAASPNGNVLRRSPNGNIDPSLLEVEVRHEPGSHRTAATVTESKLDLILTALRSDTGATVAELADLTGWKPKSIRAALASQLKGKMKLDVQVVEQPHFPNRYKLRHPTT